MSFCITTAGAIIQIVPKPATPESKPASGTESR